MAASAPSPIGLNDMNSEQFRRQLRHESEQWWSEGLINADLYEKLADRYQFDRLEQDASHRFIMILMGLGAVLLGLAAITFVAANWQAWPRSFKVVLLLSCFLGVTVTGFYLWNRPEQQRHRRLGHGLLLLGALLLGANLGLVSQMFHQSGEVFELFLVWGLGMTAMAYGLRLTSLGVMAVGLVGLAYQMGFFSWFGGQDLAWTHLLIQHMPLVVSFLFVPLAYWCRSRVIFGLSAFIVAYSLFLNLIKTPSISGLSLTSGWLMAIAWLLPIALLWSYSRAMWQFSHLSAPVAQPGLTQPRMESDSFQAIARILALFLLSIVLYLFSFKGIWRVWGWFNSDLTNLIWHPLFDAMILSVFAGLGWLQIARQFQFQRRTTTAINSGLVALILLIVATVFVYYFEFTIIPLDNPAFVPIVNLVVFNILLFLFSMGLIRDGLALGDRPVFWAGMVLLILGIISRMLEYNTGLLLKSIVFGLCGVGIIAAGIWFERNAKPQSTRYLLKY
jgi:uncharacterized membrane protein